MDWTAITLSAGRLLVGVAVLILAKFARDIATPYSVESELTAKDNPAFGLAIGGYYGAVAMMFIAIALAFAPSVDSTREEVLATYALDLAWSVAGIGALLASRTLIDRALTHFSEDVVRSRNLAAGAVECGVHLACGVVVAGVVRQPGGSWLTTIVFFVFSVLLLVVLGRMYARSVGYDMLGEIRSGNFAAGVALGLTLVAFSLLIARASGGEFVDWPTNLGYFAFDAVAGLALLLALRWLTDLALLPNARIAEEISRDRNVNAGLVEGVVAVGVASMILFVF